MTYIEKQNKNGKNNWVRNATKFFVKGTEYPHTGTYNLHFENCCGACGGTI
jgi:hypothetical protein